MAGGFHPKPWRWYHAVLFWVLINIALYTGLGGDPSSYGRLREAPFAPPAWVFGPVWFLLNICVLWGNLQLLNQRDLRYRHTLLGLQGLSWIIYATFSFVNFQLKSPVLAFDWTFAMLLLTLISVMLSWNGDRKIAFSLLPLLAWLCFATVLATYQMMYNPDPLFGPAPMGR
jgi:tryptophan-rich sensory protein